MTSTDGGGIGSHSPVHGVPTLPQQIVSQLRRPGPLEDPRLAALVLGIAAAAAIALVVRGRRRRRAGVPPRRLGARLALRTLAGTGVAVLTVAGVLLGINAYAGYAPTLASLPGLFGMTGPAPRGDTAPMAHHSWRVSLASGAGNGRLVLLSIGAPALHIPPRPAYVLLPAGYADPANAARRYPVVYLIHGYPGGAQDWLTAGRAGQALGLLTAWHLVSPMILVMPDANGGWLHDSECLDAVGGGPQVERYLTGPVVTTVDREFRTIGNRTGRAIGGMSSGAFCALNLGLRHQREFSTILASEPFGDPGHRVFGPILGNNEGLWLANSPSQYIPSMRFRDRMAVFLDAGTDDRNSARTARLLAAELSRRGQYVALRLSPGLGHTWREARAELPYSLVFASAHLAAATPGDVPTGTTATTVTAAGAAPPATSRHAQASLLAVSQLGRERR